MLDKRVLDYNVIIKNDTWGKTYRAEDGCEMISRLELPSNSWYPKKVR